MWANFDHFSVTNKQNDGAHRNDHIEKTLFLSTSLCNPCQEENPKCYGTQEMAFGRSLSPLDVFCHYSMNG